mmetsp:Transcript_27868/g.50285  ORF Transcript_27868/g.50285 Transcript_27868/m.50285 type:complete len:242 (+) Transcript_27868:322-1047(+)
MQEPKCGKGGRGHRQGAGHRRPTGWGMITPLPHATRQQAASKSQTHFGRHVCTSFVLISSIDTVEALHQRQPGYFLNVAVSISPKRFLSSAECGDRQAHLLRQQRSCCGSTTVQPFSSVCSLKPGQPLGELLIVLAVLLPLDRHQLNEDRTLVCLLLRQTGPCLDQGVHVLSVLLHHFADVRKAVYAQIAGGAFQGVCSLPKRKIVVLLITDLDVTKALVKLFVHHVIQFLEELGIVIYLL